MAARRRRCLQMSIVSSSSRARRTRLPEKWKAKPPSRVSRTFVDFGGLEHRYTFVGFQSSPLFAALQHVVHTRRSADTSRGGTSCVSCFESCCPMLKERHARLASHDTVPDCNRPRKVLFQRTPAVVDCVTFIGAVERVLLAGSAHAGNCDRLKAHSPSVLIAKTSMRMQATFMTKPVLTMSLSFIFPCS
uniref:Uncharacterized protein n=1 Tax=Ixodes ricinus TaxID=34613 RepID=A0A6B0V1E2_IXORI